MFTLQLQMFKFDFLEAKGHQPNDNDLMWQNCKFFET